MKRSISGKYLKNILKSSGLLSLVIMAFAILLPSQVMAQAEVCNSDVTISAAGDEPFFINEPIPITVQISAGAVNDGLGNNGQLQVRSFSYVTDCDLADSGLDCEPAGNTVIVATPDNAIGGTCVGPYTTSSANGGLTIDFDPNPDVLLDADTACTVEFDVMVTAAAGDTVAIKQVAGWLSTEVVCVEPDGTPYPDDVNSGASGELTFALSTERAGFNVTKDFTDDNPMPVDVHLSCNTGIPLQQSFSITDPDTDGRFPGVGFVVKDYAAGQMNCRVWEDPVPGGYTESYVASGTGSASAVYADETGCYFEGVETGSFTCAVTDSLDPTSVKVNKMWLGDVLNNDIELTAAATYSCFNVRDEDDGDLGTIFGVLEFEGASDSDFITGLYPSYLGNSYCEVTEVNVPSAAESDASDCADVAVTTPPAECTIYNTVFFEGIPTLSEYGLALMALLMLGVGMVGFRRFS